MSYLLFSVFSLLPSIFYLLFFYILSDIFSFFIICYLLSSVCYLLYPFCHLLSAISNLTSLISHLLSPIFYLRSSISYLLSLNSYLLTPLYHLLYFISHLPSPISYLLSHISDLLSPSLPTHISYLPSQISYQLFPISYLLLFLLKIKRIKATIVLFTYLQTPYLMPHKGFVLVFHKKRILWHFSKLFTQMFYLICQRKNPTYQKRSRGFGNFAQHVSHYTKYISGVVQTNLMFCE